MKASVLSSNAPAFKPMILEVVIESEWEALELCKYLGQGEQMVSGAAYKALVNEIDNRGISR